jgi:L-alanine-DL-glutamate epimerase-like enolase superfamily enzyme
MLKTEVIDARVEFLSRPFIKPLQISSGICREITEARVFVQVRVDGREASGIGSIYLSDLWAWPQPELTHEEKDLRMRTCCLEIARKLPGWSRPGAHPLELGLGLHEQVCHGGDESTFPVLARAICLSPFDAAVHDAAGRALNRSAFTFYDEAVPLPAADRYFESKNAAGAIRQTLQAPKTALDAWWMISAAEDLAVSFGPLVREGGYRCFKIKLLGRDVADDVARTVAVHDAARAAGISAPRLSVDVNEANADPGQPLEFLNRLFSDRPDVFDSVAYLEQPTHRDIAAHPHDWRKVSRLKPVLLDEGLTGLEVLPLAERQGWSGVALKTCKGHSFTLVAAAWASVRNLPLAMQDLTNPGYSAIHSFLTAAHLDTINGVELNSPQYTPAANADWMPRRSDLFQVKQGRHHLAPAKLVGLGSDL